MSMQNADVAITARQIDAVEKARAQYKDVMARWRKHDPVVACRKYAKNLRKLRGVFVDCGMKDEFALHAGARILVKRLRELGVKPLVHEEFDDGHMDISYRYDRSLPWLGKWIGA